jgi:hypothetical protein
LKPTTAQTIEFSLKSRVSELKEPAIGEFYKRIPIERFPEPVNMSFFNFSTFIPLHAKSDIELTSLSA